MRPVLRLRVQAVPPLRASTAMASQWRAENLKVAVKQGDPELEFLEAPRFFHGVLRTLIAIYELQSQSIVQPGKLKFRSD